MIIENDFDIMEMIYEAENGQKFSKLARQGLARSAPLYIPTPILLATSYYFFKEEFYSTLSLATLSVIPIIFASYLLNKIKAPYHKLLAEIKLEFLVYELTKLEVDTSRELLKEAEVIQTDYELVFSDDKISVPKLNQKKYISVPLSNGGEETLLQEHFVGFKDYELSVGSPTKKLSFKPIKQV